MIFSSIAAIALLVTFTAAVTKSAVNLSSIVEAFTEAPTQEVISSRVVNVVDGETLTIRLEGDEYRIRLYGIDTPENGQPWGGQARLVRCTT